MMVYNDTKTRAKNRKKIADVAETNVIGGRQRKINVMLDKNKMAGHYVDPLMIMMQVN